MAGKQRNNGTLAVILLILLLAVGLWAQQDKKSDIPDAPSAAQPPQPFPNAAPAPKNESRPADTTPAEPPPSETGPPATPSEANTAPAGAVRDNETNSRDELPTFISRVNFVQVPVTVKDENGRLVGGLLPKDFAVFENGEKQKMTFFTSDPFPLSVAVIFDLGMPDSAVQKMNQSFSALEGAFSQFDEVSVYTYSGTVSRVTGFGAVGQLFSETLGELKTKRGRNDGPPVLGGPMATQGPAINGRPVDPNAPVVVTPPRESHVINDAILQAALDLNKRDKSRRRIILVVSNGREYGSRASYADVLKVLLTNGISVYGMNLGDAPIPGFKSLQKLHLPKMGTDNILPKYASATGGEVFDGGSKREIDEVYTRSVANARNQYTIGYMTKATPSGSFREIEVRVARPDCGTYSPPCVRTAAKAGYYPAPPVQASR
jgi:VWFA-related protein